MGILGCFWPKKGQKGVKKGCFCPKPPFSYFRDSCPWWAHGGTRLHLSFLHLGKPSTLGRAGALFPNGRFQPTQQDEAELPPAGQSTQPLWRRA